MRALSFVLCRLRFHGVLRRVVNLTGLRNALFILDRVTDKQSTPKTLTNSSGLTQSSFHTTKVHKKRNVRFNLGLVSTVSFRLAFSFARNIWIFVTNPTHIIRLKIIAQRFLVHRISNIIRLRPIMADLITIS